MDIQEIDLKTFMAFMNSQPKCVIKAVDVKNPTTNATIKKNLIDKFVD
jgi:hypothetical protein